MELGASSWAAGSSHFLIIFGSCAFEQVDDESKPERRPSKHMRTPKEWDLVHNPAYAYYAYYVWVRMRLRFSVAQREPFTQRDERKRPFWSTQCGG